MGRTTRAQRKPIATLVSGYVVMNASLASQTFGVEVRGREEQHIVLVDAVPDLRSRKFLVYAGKHTTTFNAC